MPTKNKKNSFTTYKEVTPLERLTGVSARPNSSSNSNYPFTTYSDWTPLERLTGRSTRPAASAVVAPPEPTRPSTVADIVGKTAQAASAQSLVLPPMPQKETQPVWQTRPYWMEFEENEYNGLNAAKAKIGNAEEVEHANALEQLRKDNSLSAEEYQKRLNELNRKDPITQNRAEIAKLERAKSEAHRKDALSAYEGVKVLPDFAQMAETAKGNTRTQQDLLAEYGDAMTAAKNVKVENPVYYEWLNREQVINGQKERSSSNTVAHMTEDEMNVYNYYFAKYGKEKADEYYKTLEPTLTERNYAETVRIIQEEMPDYAKAIIPVIADMFAPLAYVENAVNAFTGNDTDINRGAVSFSRLGGVAQQEVLKDAGPIGQFLGGVVYSMVNMGTKIPFGPAGALAYMTGSAAGHTTADALERGADEKTALALGTLSGMIEFATEKIPLEEWFKVAKTGGKTTVSRMIKGTLKQSGMEAAEETVSEYANTVMDIALMGEKSEYAQYKNELMKQGLSEAEAENLANMEFFVWNPLKSAAGGAISGAFFGAGAQVVGSTRPVTLPDGRTVLVDENNKLVTSENGAQTAFHEAQEITPVETETAPVIATEAASGVVEVPTNNQKPIMMPGIMETREGTNRISWEPVTKDGVSNASNAFEQKWGISTRVMKPNKESGASAFLQNGVVVLNADKVNTYSGAAAKIVHEAAHIVENSNYWDAMKSAALEYYRLVNPDLTQNQLREIARERYNGVTELNDKGADGEVVAGFLESICGENQYIADRAVQLLLEKPNLFNRIRNFFADKVRYLKAKKNLSASEKQELAAARRALNNLARGLKAVQDGGARTSSGTQYSFSSIANTFFNDPDMTSVDFDSRDYKQTEGYKNYVEECLNNMRQTRDDFDAAKARKEIEHQIDGIVRVAKAAKQAGFDIYDDPNRASKTDSKNRLLFSSLEPNSEYFTSSDISTICDKRKNFAEIYDDIVRAEEEKGVPKGKRFFDNVDNYFYIHKVLADKGLTQPCRQCYVESMRKNLAPMANAFLRLVNETNVNNKANDQLYVQRGKKKGEVKTNNFELRQKILDTLSEHPEYELNVTDLTVEMLTTSDGLAKLKIQAPLIYEAFNSFYGQSKPKMPKEATPFRFGELTALLTDNNGKIKKSLVDRINSTGGFRLQSYSDFQIQNYTDVLQVIFEAGTLGLNGHAYTKVPAFLQATEGTNLKRNISIFMYKDGKKWKIDRNDSFPYRIEKIYEIVNNDKSGDTGIIAVSQNKEMSAWIMANDQIGYGIPFHKSGMKMGTVRDTDVITEDGRVVKGYSGTIDHTKQQTEVWAKTTADHKALTKVKKGINIYGEEVGWDFDNKGNLPKNKLIEKNVKAYIDACERAGYIPKFRDYVMNNEGVLKDVLRFSKELGFVSEDATIDNISFKYKGYTIPYGYYKFLGDYSMITPSGKASPQKTLSLENYNFDKAVKFFNDSSRLRRNEILQQFANGEERQKYQDSDLTTEELTKIIKQRRSDVVNEIVGDTSYSYGEDSFTDYALKYLAQKYGTMPKGEMPSRDVVIPLKTSEKLNVRRGARTIIEAGSVSDEMAERLKEEVAKEALSYQTISDKSAEKYADETIKSRGIGGALDRWDAVVNGDERPTKNTLVLGEKLMLEAGKAGDVDTFLKLAAEVSAEATRAGQIVQAMHLIKRMTPEGRLYYVEKAISAKQKDLNKKYGKKATQLNLPKELGENLLKAETQEQIDAAEEAILAEVAKQMPSTWRDKWDAWRYMAMLFNPRTHIRNAFGNAVFVPTRSLKNAAAYFLDKTVSQENRTVAFLTKKDKALRNFAENNFKEVSDVLKSGGKMNPSTRLDDLRKIFTSKVFAWLEWLRVFNNKWLEKEDMFFLRRAYVNSFAKAMKARGLTAEFLSSDSVEARTALNRIQQLATKEALEATYRDASEFAKTLNRFKEGKVGYLIGNALFPFTKTPVNILKRGVEYSPVSIIKGIVDVTYSVRKGKKTATEAINDWSKGLTGLGVVAFGYFLSHLGILVAGGPEDPDERAFETLQGAKTYSLKIGDVYYTIDWIAPTSLPLFVGAEMHKTLNDNEGFSFKSVMDSMTRISEPMFNLSMLDGLNDSIQSIAYAENGRYLENFAVTAVVDYITQALPTLGGQLARTIDPQARNSYYIDKNSWAPKAVQEFLNTAQAKLPGLTFLLSPSVDAWGRETGEKNAILRAFTNFISPGYYSVRNETPVDKEIAKIYEATGDKSVLPEKPEKTITVDKEKRDLTAAQYTQLTQENGQRAYEYVNQLMKSDFYDSLSPDGKAEQISKMYTLAAAEARKEVMPDYEIPQTVINLYKASEQGVLFGFIETKENADTDRNSYLNNDETRTYLDKLNIPKDKKALIFSLTNPKAKNNPYD